MTTAPLDSIDRRILEELGADARLPIVTLARRVELSRQATRQRISRMEEQGIIRGYTLQLGDAGTPKSEAIIRVFRKDRMRGKDVADAIARIPEVVSCYVVSGESDLVVHVKADSQERLGQIWSHLASLPGVVDTITAFVLSTVVNRA